MNAVFLLRVSLTALRVMSPRCASASPLGALSSPLFSAGDSKESRSTRIDQSLSAPNYIAEDEDGDDEEVDDEEDGGGGEDETLQAGIRAEMDLWLGEAEKEFGVASGSAKLAQFVARLLCERLPALIAVRAPPPLHSSQT